MAQSSQTTFEKLQARWRDADEALRGLLFTLRHRYGDANYAKRGERSRLDKLRERETKAGNAIFAWLDQNSPRDFRHGVPAHWACDELTYADAVTYGQMSAIPPAAYGYSPSDSIRFAAPLQFSLKEGAA